jgi:Tfp pilus assembly protein PilO
MDELKDKYRAFPIWARLLMAFIIGIAPGACSYFDEVGVVEAGLAEAQAREEVARQKFEASRKTKAEIPKLEEQLVFTEGQLEQASKKLPESYLIESVLSLTATNAKQAGISLTGFKPSCELKGQSEFKFVERAIAVSAVGKFQQLASFFDKMVHSEMMLFVREIAIEPNGSKAVDATPEATTELTPYQIAEKARQNLTLKASFKVVVFRAMKTEEETYFENKESCETESPSAEAITPVPPGAQDPTAPAPVPTDAAPAAPAHSG